MIGQDRERDRDDNRNSVGTGAFSDNYGFYGASALQIRLDTSKVIQEIEMYLRGFRDEWYQDKDGIFKTRQVWSGKAMLNPEGIQNIMSFVISVFNNQVVQGNFLDYDMYAEFLCRTRKELSFNLMMCMYDYELHAEDYGGIMSVLMRYIEVFMTRPLFNKERESYAQTLQSKEVMNVSNNHSEGGVKGFFRRIF